MVVLNTGTTPWSEELSDSTLVVSHVWSYLMLQFCVGVKGYYLSWSIVMKKWHCPCGGKTISDCLPKYIHLRQWKILHILKVNLRLINYSRLWLLTLQVLVCLQDGYCADKARVTLLPSITLGSVFSRTNNSLFSLFRTWSNHRSHCHIHRDFNSPCDLGWQLWK